MANGAARDWQKEAKWRRWLRAQRESGLSVRAWCRRHGQRESAFYWWRTQVARREAEAARFAPVRVIADAACDGAAHSRLVGDNLLTPTALETSAGRIEIFLPGGCRVDIVGRIERPMLADVLALLTAATAPNIAEPGARPNLTHAGTPDGREAPAC
jgi:hypothetical protein